MREQSGYDFNRQLRVTKWERGRKPHADEGLKLYIYIYKYKRLHCAIALAIDVTWAKRKKQAFTLLIEIECGDWKIAHYFATMVPARLFLLILVAIMLAFASDARPLSFPKRIRTQCPPGYKPIRSGGCRKILVPIS